MRNPLSDRRNSTSPGLRGFGKSDRERSHQSAVSIALLEKPLPPQWLAADPIEQIPIYLGTYCLHQVESEAVSRRSIHMQDTDTRIEPECGKGKSRF
jgi:hypothetical protein